MARAKILTDQVTPGQLPPLLGSGDSTPAESAQQILSSAIVEEFGVTTGYFPQAITSAGGAILLPLLIAPVPLYVKSIRWSVESGAVTQDASNSWSFRFRRFKPGVAYGTGNGDELISSTGLNYSTTSTFAQGAVWDSDWRIFDRTNGSFNVNDVLRARIAPTGAPGNLTGLFFTVHWEPIG